MLSTEARDQTPVHAGGYEIPDFERDARTTALYKETLDRRIKAHASDREGEVQRAFAQRRDALEAEMRGAAVFVEDRRAIADAAMAAYRTRCPGRVKKTRVLRPSFIETILSFGGANRLHRAADDALGALNKALSKQRGFAAEYEGLDREMARALVHATESANKAVGSAEWLASIHESDKHLAALKRQADEIARERAAYAERLAAGQVSDVEKRDRAFAADNIHPVELPLTGIMFYRLDVYGQLAYYILRDLKQRLYALPYDPHLDSIADGVFDIYRVGAGWEVRLRVQDDKLPFTILHHFITWHGGESAGKEAYRAQRAWMRSRPAARLTPADHPIETQVRDLLTGFAETLPASPRAPRI